MRHPVPRAGRGEVVQMAAQSYSLTCPFKSREGARGAPNLYPAFVLIDPRMNYSSIKISQKALLADRNTSTGKSVVWVSGQKAVKTV